MKYPQLVSTRAVSTISDWLITRLETLGVEAPIVYSRLLLSLLHTPLQVNTSDLAEIPQLKNWLGKRFNSRRLTQSDAEKLKRFAAIESLMDVVEANQKRSRIVDLVSELCYKLRELERSEEEIGDRAEEIIEVTDRKPSSATERGTAAAIAGGAKHKEAAVAAREHRPEEKKSNPYYQMFPALSGNIPASSNSSRGTSLSGNSYGGGGGGGGAGESSNWGRFSGSDSQQQQQQQNPAKWKVEPGQLMSNSTPTQELFMEGGDKGQAQQQHKRKNKKRRTNGSGATDKKTFAASSPSSSSLLLKMKPAANGQRKKPMLAADKNKNELDCSNPELMTPFQQYYRKPMGKYVEWDTNFSGNWEMEEQDPIREFMNKQRVACDGDCESMNGSVKGASVSGADDGYDNVFKMKRSDVNEEQTMLIKSFLSKPSTASGSHNLNHNNEAKNLNVTHEVHHVDAEDLFNRFSQTDFESAIMAAVNGGGGESPMRSGNWSPGEEKRRLFEREVSTESLLMAQEVLPPSNCPTDGVEPPTEFDANLDAFKAKFGTSIKNLWQQDEASANEEPISLNSFWQNYNRHLYEEQDGPQQNENVIAGGWPTPATLNYMGPASGETFNQPPQQPQNTFPPQRQTTIWSNGLNELEELRNLLQEYNEHMAAAYKKQMAFNENLSYNAASSTIEQQLDLFSATGKSSQWASDGDSFVSGSTGFEVNQGSVDLEQLYSSSFPGCDYNNVAVAHDALSVDLNCSAENAEVANLKLEQSIAMINHSKTSSFAKVDRRIAVKGRGPGPSSSITNMSSLYGSFKQNSMENLLTSERTHFRPIKQAYLDGHTFDIPCSPDQIDYMRSESGYLFFELDKYMEYDLDPNVEEIIHKTNVPITRCGQFEEEDEDRVEREADLLPPANKRAKDESDGYVENNKFTLKFCVKQNEKCCQTEVIDYEKIRRLQESGGTAMVRPAASSTQMLSKYPYAVPKNLPPIMGEILEAVAHELLEDKRNYSGPATATTTITGSDLSMLWDNSGSNSLDSSLNYESLPANRLLRDELSADAEEILKDSLTYMQNLYIDDMDDEAEEEEDGGGDERMAGDVVQDVDLANYYGMGQLISEILNPGTVKKIAQAFGGDAAVAAAEVTPMGSSNDILWYKNWSERSWLPIPDQDAVASLWKARNVWHYGASGQAAESDNNNNNLEDQHDAYEQQQRRENASIYGGHEDVLKADCNTEESSSANATDGWKFSNLRMLWNDTQMMLNEEAIGEDLAGGGGAGTIEDDEEAKNYLIIFEKKEPSTAVLGMKGGGSGSSGGGRKRRHSASQNLYDDDLEFFNGNEVKWYDYCCRCDCGKRSEKILRYRNKLLMKRVDKLGYVHNASLLWKNLSKQFDSIDEILNEGLLPCNGIGLGGGEVCEYEGEYCGPGAAIAADKLTFEQVSLLKNPNMYLNRTALISMARPLTR